jgi:hypothetical protein
MLQQNVDDEAGHLHRKFIGVAGALLPLAAKAAKAP